MESLLGNVEEERREQEEESFGEGTLKATSDNKYEEKASEPQQGATITSSSTSPNTDVTSSACPLEGPDGGTQNSEGSVTSDPAVQDPESAEVRNPESSPNPGPDVSAGSKIENGDVCEKNETGDPKEEKCEDSERISGSEITKVEVSAKCPDKASEASCVKSEEAGIVCDGSSTGETNVPPPETSSAVSKPGEVDPAKSELSKPAELSSELANLFSGELPSVSELQLLLPGVIQDISQGSGNHAFSQQAVRGTNPTLIPEPKRLDREECRLNLLNHVEELQVLVDARLEEIENRLDAVDPSTNSSCSTTPSSSSASSSAPVYTSSAAVSSLSRILLDLRAARKITSTSFLNNIP